MITEQKFSKIADLVIMKKNGLKGLNRNAYGTPAWSQALEDTRVAHHKLKAIFKTQAIRN